MQPEPVWEPEPVRVPEAGRQRDLGAALVWEACQVLVGVVRVVLMWEQPTQLQFLGRDLLLRVMGPVANPLRLRSRAGVTA